MTHLGILKEAFVVYYTIKVIKNQQDGLDDQVRVQLLLISLN